jgi:hypothetical protein
MGVMYFSSDDGIDLYPANMTFNPKWGAEGDRVVVGFYYNPYTVAENTNRMNVDIENLIAVQTDRSALPSIVDTVGTGKFLYEYNGSQSGIVAWANQNYLTATFFVKYGDATKHTFGFIEETELFRHDTLFLTMWHNTKEDDKTLTAKNHIALNLSNYNGYLSARDSTVISIKYDAENLDSSSSASYTYNVMYRKKSN